jgi:hypothetical protein
MDMPRTMLGPASRSTHFQSSLSKHTHTHTKGLVVTGYLTQMQINYSAVFTHLTTFKNIDYPGQIRKPVTPLLISSVPDTRDAPSQTSRYGRKTPKGVNKFVMLAGQLEGPGPSLSDTTSRATEHLPRNRTTRRRLRRAGSVPAETTVTNVEECSCVSG